MADDASPSSTSYRILVVDDEDALRRVIRLMLTRHGHSVAIASNGAEALRVIRNEPFDVVLTDLIMPDMDGIQLVRELRSVDSPPRIVAMSGGGRGSKHNYLNMAAHLGAVATLEKPFTEQELLDAVARAARPAAPAD